VTIEEVQARLPDLIDGLQPGEVVITRNAEPVALATTRLTLLPVEVGQAHALTTLPLHHRDPFDRRLVAQARVENVPLLSADPVLDAYPVTRLW